VFFLNTCSSCVANEIKTSQGDRVGTLKEEKKTLKEFFFPPNSWMISQSFCSSVVECLTINENKKYPGFTPHPGQRNKTSYSRHCGSSDLPTKFKLNSLDDSL
jgi:hypothetical protein